MDLFYWYDGSYKNVEGNKIKFDFFEGFVTKNLKEPCADWEKWVIIEVLSGLIVSRGMTKETAIKNAQYLSKRYGEKYTLEHILSCIEEYGGIPSLSKHKQEIKDIKNRLKELKSSVKEKKEEPKIIVPKTSLVVEENQQKVTVQPLFTEEKRKRGRPRKCIS